MHGRAPYHTVTHDQIRERFIAAVNDALGALSGPSTKAEFEALRVASAAFVDSHGRLDATAQVALTVLQVRADILCVPVLGELDAARTTRVVEAVVALALAHNIGHVVLDVTGAQPTPNTLLHLGRVFAALESLGVQGALSGVSEEIVGSLADSPDALDGVRCFTELASALAALRPRRLS